MTILPLVGIITTKKEFSSLAGTVITPTRLINNIGSSETVCRLLDWSAAEWRDHWNECFLSVSYKDFSAALEMTILPLVGIITTKKEWRQYRKLPLAI